MTYVVGFIVVILSWWAWSRCHWYTATPLKDVSCASDQRAWLYEMCPRHEGHRYVVVSAVQNAYVHETYLFPADSDGLITSYREMSGSIRDTTSHEEALREAGYRVLA